MTDDTLPTASLLPIGQDAHRPHPAEAEDSEDWDVVHEGLADTPDHGAQALMRTSDGDFRISAAEVDGKVGLKIERFHPHDSDHEEDEGDGEDVEDAIDVEDAVDAEDADDATADSPRVAESKGDVDSDVDDISDDEADSDTDHLH